MQQSSSGTGALWTIILQIKAQFCHLGRLFPLFVSANYLFLVGTIENKSLNLLIV